MTTALVELRAIAQKLEKQPFHPSHELALSLVNAAVQALTYGNGAREVKEIHDNLRVAELLFKKYGAQSVDANLLVAQRIRTAHKLGRMLTEYERGKPKPYQKTISRDGKWFLEFIGSLNIPKTTAYRLQWLSSIELAEIENYVTEHANEPDCWLSLAAVMSLMPKPPLKDVQIPSGKFRTIVIDPPWDMEKIGREERPVQVAFDYPTMNEEELTAFPVSGLAYESCHLYLWTTQKYLPVGLRLLEAWGFNYIFTMVWHKPGGYQPFGLPQYNCEFVLFARRGDLDFLDTKNFPTCFGAPRQEHSRKPKTFYDLVRRVSPEPRVDLFSREQHDGFEQSGDEVDKFSAEA